MQNQQRDCDWVCWGCFSQSHFCCWWQRIVVLYTKSVDMDFCYRNGSSWHPIGNRVSVHKKCLFICHIYHIQCSQPNLIDKTLRMLWRIVIAELYRNALDFNSLQKWNLLLSPLLRCHSYAFLCFFLLKVTLKRRTLEENKSLQKQIIKLFLIISPVIFPELQ